MVRVPIDGGDDRPELAPCIKSASLLGASYFVQVRIIMRDGGKSSVFMRYRIKIQLPHIQAAQLPVGAHPVRDCHAWVYRFVGLSRTGCAPTNGQTATLIRYLSACVPFVGAHLCATAALRRNAPSVCRAQVRFYKGAARIFSSATRQRAQTPVGAHPVRDGHAWVCRFVGLSRTGCAPTNRPSPTLICHPQANAHPCRSAPCARPSRVGVSLRRVVAHRVRSYRWALGA